ncbi:DUF4365 domain-containing protein, partial [Acinetobacter baumannii]|nr:DUF4365 domain-containing protein [Acinetobacter baumannii]
YQEQIKQFYAIVMKPDQSEVKVEFNVENKNVFECDKVASILVIFCRIGSHSIGAILTFIGKPEQISKKKFKVENGDLIIERTFVPNSNKIDFNKEVQLLIDNISSKYIDEYDVFYNWGQ